MKTTINVGELKLKGVNNYLFFNYLIMALNDANGFEFNDFYNLFKNIKIFQHYFAVLKMNQI